MVYGCAGCMGRVGEYGSMARSLVLAVWPVGPPYLSMDAHPWSRAPHGEGARAGSLHAQCTYMHMYMSCIMIMHDDHLNLHYNTTPTLDFLLGNRPKSGTPTPCPFCSKRRPPCSSQLHELKFRVWGPNSLWPRRTGSAKSKFADRRRKNGQKSG